MIPSQCRFRNTVLSLMVAAVSTVSLYTPSIAQLPGVGPRMAPPNAVRPLFKGDGSGLLEAVTKSGQKVACPLKHTSVSVSIAGHVSRVTVKQLFSNPLADKIEAIYTFPLSDTGAVDDMLMKVGSRTIHGTIKKREEARQIYEAARASGHVAALLDQQRPNIFTQSVANIEPHKDVEVTISYVDLLQYEAGTYTFAFPTVVGPRFNPGRPIGKEGLGFSPDTDAVPDASKITPHVAPQGQRAGHDIAINVTIDSPVSISNMRSKLHDVHVANKGDRHAEVSLTNKETIPNKDFVLTWAVASDQVKSGYLTTAKDGQGFFNLSIMPPKRVRPDQVQPKEMVFLIDCSGSQSGLPLQKAKETMFYALDHMNDDDTFQVISFSSGATELFTHPEKASGDSRKKAHNWINSLQANGGTWMAPAVEKACKIPADSNRLRIVTFMTDGYVGNDFEVVGMIKKLRGTSRWFPFGTGNSVNRFLIDNIAREGGGEADYVYLNSSAEEVGKKFYEKISSPVLTDVKVDFDGVEVKEVFPKVVSDVWAERPLYFTGRYTKAGKGKVTITGFSGGKSYKQELAVDFPQNNAANSVLAPVWARAKVDRLMAEDWLGAQSGSVNKELKDEIIATALQHHIMTQYTSFVAVEEQKKTRDGKLVTVEVPVEMPEGVSREGVFGEQAKSRQSQHGSKRKTSASYANAGGYGAGSGSARGAVSPSPTFANPKPPVAFQSVNGPKTVVDSRARPQEHNMVAQGISSADEEQREHALPPKTKSNGATSRQDFLQPLKATGKEELQRPEAKQQDKKADGDNSSKDSPDAKLSAALRTWLLSSDGSPTMQVKITFKDHADAVKHLRLKGLKVTKSGSKTGEVIATVTRSALRNLLELESVNSISQNK